MAETRRDIVVNVFNELISNLGTTLAQPDIQPSHKRVGRKYLDVAKLQLTYILEKPESHFDTHLSDPLLHQCQEWSKNVSRFVDKADWPGALQETYALLAELPGKPGSVPIKLPRPPGSK